MNCNGNCNQGRACTCAEPAKPSRVMKAAIAITIIILVAVFAILLELRYSVTEPWTATILAILFGLASVGCLLWWIAEKVIDAINWMTRMEDL